MFGQVPETAYDLRFTLLGVPVRVHPFFWGICALIGWPRQDVPGSEALLLLLVATACVFLSILVHEMGHALTAKAFGWRPHVVLYHLGGYASFFPDRGFTTSRSVAVSFAGPAAGFLLFGLVVGIQMWLVRAGITVGPHARLAFFYLEWINLYWGLVNLLPVYPLDGGKISFSLLTAWMPRNGWSVALQLSIAVAVIAAVWFFRQQYLFAALLFGSLAFEGFQMLQAGGRSRYW